MEYGFLGCGRQVCILSSCQKFSMIKYLINKNQSLFLYLLSNILFLLIPLISLFIDVYGKESFSCYRSMGSFVLYDCNLKEYLFDYIFWIVFVIIYAQIVLIPAAIITYLLINLLQEKYKSPYTKKLWFKHLSALFIYIISIFITTLII